MNKLFEGHTPGPWQHIDYNLPGESWGIEIFTDNPELPMGRETIALIPISRWKFERPAKTDYANANLITAAPDLLAENERTLKWAAVWKAAAKKRRAYANASARVASKYIMEVANLRTENERLRAQIAMLESNERENILLWEEATEQNERLRAALEEALEHFEHEWQAVGNHPASMWRYWVEELREVLDKPLQGRKHGT